MHRNLMSRLVTILIVAIAPQHAIADVFLVFTKTDGTQIAAEVEEDVSCRAKFWALLGWEGTRIINNRNQVSSSSSIELSQVKSIIHNNDRSWNINAKSGAKMLASEFGGTIIFLQGVTCPDGNSDYIRSHPLSVVNGKLRNAPSPLYPANELRFDNSLNVRNVERIDIFSDRASSEAEMKRQEALRNAERKEAAAREAQERKEAAAREAQERKETIAREQVAKKFRSTLGIGTETHCGMIIEKNGPIVKIQTIAGEKWFRAEQIYPPQHA